MFNLVAITIEFTKSIHIVNESTGFLQLGIVFSNPSATNITLNVTDIENTASSKLAHMYVYY